MRFLKSLKNSLIIAAITVSVILLIDGIITACKLLPEPPGKVDAFRTSHAVYHHDFKPDYTGNDFWGPRRYVLCTDEFGFRISCQNRTEHPDKHFDIAFIGDSFTEGVGVPYEESFVGLYAAKHPEYRVANLGVSSYSPSIYLKKMEYLLSHGFTFKHVVVLPDISDIQDEAKVYMVDPDTGAVVSRFSRKPMPWPKKIRTEIRGFFSRHFMFTSFFFRKLSYYKENFFSKEKGTPGLDFKKERCFWTTDFDCSDFGKIGVRGGIKLALGYMRDLKALLDKHKITMSVVVYPWPSQLVNDAPGHPGVAIWREFCEKNGCANFLDANPFYFAEVAKSNVRDVINTYYIPDDVHFNAKGNAVMFRLIDEQIVP